MHQFTNASRFASSADRAACLAMLRGGSRTFYAASWALPIRVRIPSIGLYAFCRMADDAVDQGLNPEAALHDLRRRLAAIYAGQPADASADRAFADSVQAHGIPQAFPDGLLEGFEWDAGRRRYEDLAQLTGYAVRVAGTVGAMMAMVMGVRSRTLIARACDLGVAMQLTNIARDVGEDARLGRLYLPLQWLRAVNIDPDEWLAKPEFTPPLRSVIQRLLQTADTLYRRADAGLAGLPAGCRPGMRAARLLYAEIGHELARRGYDSVNHRAVVSSPRKAQLLMTALWAGRDAATSMSSDILEQAAFILDSLPEPPGDPSRPSATWPGVEDRVLWLVDLFEKLERREHTA